MNIKRITSAIALTFAVALAAPAVVFAAPTTEVVKEGDVVRQAEGTPPTNEWVIYTRAGTPPSSATFRSGPDGAPLGTGSLELQTVLGTEKVYAFNYDHVGTAIADVDDISYSTYRTAGSAQQVAALNVQIDYNGAAAGGFATLVFEPVYNTGQGPVTSGEWQEWIADGSGVWWSTQPINGQCAGATATCDKTWAEIVANNPDATVLAVGVNQGSGNPGLTTAVDAFTFDETTYDFEPNVVLTSKEACKNGGWETSDVPVYKNQGDCVSAFASNGKAKGNPSVVQSISSALSRLF